MNFRLFALLELGFALYDCNYAMFSPFWDKKNYFTLDIAERYLRDLKFKKTVF